MQRAMLYSGALFALFLLSFSQADTAGGTVAGERCVVEYSGVDPSYASALGVIYDGIWQGYLDTFGIKPPADAVIKITTGAESTRLWTDGDRYIFLELASEADLEPDSGYFHIYGMCHETGHMVMYSRIQTLAGLPDGLGEGWARYAGSLVCDYLWETLGSNAWPQSHDYSDHGAERLSAQCAKGAATPETLAACTFYSIGEAYGHVKVGRALRGALNTEPRGDQLIGRFAEVLDAQTGSQASSVIPEAMRRSVPQLTGEVTMLDSGIAGATSAPMLNEEGWLLYDDGMEEGMRSIAGSGHTVKFTAARGKLEAVMIKGARYGMPRSDSSFILSILDGNLAVLKQFAVPYMDFMQRGEPLYWKEFDTGGLEVPAEFYVNFDFNPTATDGVYVGYDAGASGHSYSGLPGGSLTRFREGEWMIRARLESPGASDRPARKQQPGGWLKHDDGSEESMRSIAGSGHTVVFSSTGGRLARVRIKGARYGLPQSDSVFRLTILDGSFGEIRTIEYPYMSFADRGEPLYWVEFEPFDVTVPEVFYLNFSFDPTATDGVYVGIDENSRGHSYTGLPGGNLIELPAGDWMIQALIE